MHKPVFAVYDLKQMDCPPEWLSLPLIAVLCTLASDSRPLLLKHLVYSCRRTKAKDSIPFHMELFSLEVLISKGTTQIISGFKT